VLSQCHSDDGCRMAVQPLLSVVSPRLCPTLGRSGLEWRRPARIRALERGGELVLSAVPVPARRGAVPQGVPLLLRRAQKPNPGALPGPALLQRWNLQPAHEGVRPSVQRAVPPRPLPPLRPDGGGRVPLRQEEQDKAVFGRCKQCSCCGRLPRQRLFLRRAVRQDGPRSGQPAAVRPPLPPTLPRRPLRALFRARAGPLRMRQRRAYPAVFARAARRRALRKALWAAAAMRGARVHAGLPRAGVLGRRCLHRVSGHRCRQDLCIRCAGSLRRY
jgi:hypothetical protein